MEHKDMENAFLQCMYQYPPDFDTAKELLKKGVNINAITSSDDETLLSDIIMDCEAFDPCAYCVSKDCDNCGDGSPEIDIEKHYLLDIIKFFLENGYNVHENNGRHGSEALRALCWSTYDKAILDAAKLLLDAGANPLCLNSEGDNVLDAIKWKLSGCIPANDNRKHECLFTTLYEIVEASTDIGLDTDEEAFFAKVQGNPICFIALEDRTLWHATEHSCETDCAIFAFDDEYFLVKSNLTGENEASLTFCRCSDYNHSLFSKKIIPQSGKIEFIKANDSMGACLYFLIDNTILTVAPFDTYLIVSLTGAGPDDTDIQALDRDQLW